MPCLQLAQRVLPIADPAGTIFGNAAPKLHQSVGLFRAGEQLLIGRGILNDNFRLTIDRQHHRPPRLLGTRDEFTCLALELDQRVDVLKVDRHLAHDVNRLRLQTLEMGQAPGVGLSLGYCH